MLFLVNLLIKIRDLKIRGIYRGPVYALLSVPRLYARARARAVFRSLDTVSRIPESRSRGSLASLQPDRKVVFCFQFTPRGTRPARVALRRDRARGVTTRRTRRTPRGV